MKTKFIPGFILLLIAWAYADSVFMEYSATPDKNKVTLNWETKAEASVTRFIILRSADDKSFIEVGETGVKGPGTIYQFIDDNVYFKSTQTFFYKIRAISSDGHTVEETESLIVNPNISGIYRTWGAIKAMFR